MLTAKGTEEASIVHKGTVKRSHHMPFGAEICEAGVRFRLWAPAAREVELMLSGTHLQMEPQNDGWYESVVADAGHGSRYMYRIDGNLTVPDPASRFQPDDVEMPGEVIDPLLFDWNDSDWKGISWESAVIYELHVGTFTREGTFRALRSRLDHISRLGITVIELMPLADFPGDRNFGYDGVLPFAPDSRYGRPEELKEFIQAAHRRGIAVFLDVVYNHFGPKGNYLYSYAPQFFTDRYETPWGAAINFDGDGSGWVRRFFIENALYWLEEYHLDGLRIDAVHAIFDVSSPSFLQELADAVKLGPGRQRKVYLVLENDHNQSSLLQRDKDGLPVWYTAQWNDDLHHALHVMTTGESQGYYIDFADKPTRHLGRALTEGFAYQGESSPFRDGRNRGEPSRHLPRAAFVNFLQNHDQIGNRAFGERITAIAPWRAVRAATALLLLSPSPPLLFMGQEWGAAQPFHFFCDFCHDLAQLVREGRKREFAHFSEFRDPRLQDRIPDPCDYETYESSILRWEALEEPEHQRWLEFHRELLAIRNEKLSPLLMAGEGGSDGYRLLSRLALQAWWPLGKGSLLTTIANFSGETIPLEVLPEGALLFVSEPESAAEIENLSLPAFTAAFFLKEPAVP